MAAPARMTSSASSAASAPREAAGLRRVLAFWLVLAAFCGVSLGWSLLASVLHRLMPRRAGARLGQAVIMAGFRGGLRLMRLLGLARFDLGAIDALRDAGPMVIACNHLSLIDALLVVSRLPRAVLIAKASLWDNPALGGSVRLAGYLRNDAALPLVRAARDALRQGAHLVIFPEGTRGDGRALGRFRPGFALMAKAAGVPVQSVLLSSNTGYLGRGWKLTRMPGFPLAYRARLGPRFSADGPSAKVAAEIERAFRAALP